MTHPINSYQNCDDESHVHPYDTNVEAFEGLHNNIAGQLQFVMPGPGEENTGWVAIWNALSAVVELCGRTQDDYAIKPYAILQVIEKELS